MTKCNLCDGTGYLDHAGFAMDPCSHPGEPVADESGGEGIPEDIAKLVLEIGRGEWGQTPAHDADGHAAHVADSVRMTAEHFGQTEPQHMHGVYIEGTGIVICHTGTSPNSPQIARALTGAWNWLYEQAATPPNPTNGDAARDALAVALLSLMESRVPADVLQLLVHGSLRAKIAPNALGKALADSIRFTMRQAVEIAGPAGDEIHVQFADDHIRRWSREPFDGARTFAEIDNQPAQG